MLSREAAGSRQLPHTRDAKTLCPYCGVGCGIIATTDGSRITKIRGDNHHPANFGKLCPKGATVAQTVDVRTRLRHAMSRSSRAQEPSCVTAGEAVQHVADRLNHILQSHGPEGIAFYLSGQLTTESQYLFNKFAKGYLRTNHVDSNSRLCMSSAASAMTLSLGSDGPPTCYADIDLADTFLFIGSNAAECHPIVFGRVERRLEKRRTHCVVVDPRRTKTAESANLHLAVRPGTDLALLNGLLYLLDMWGKIDPAFIAAHTEGWAELRAMLPQYPPHRVSQICGIGVPELLQTAKTIADAKRLITFWTMGVNQTLQGTFTSNAIINLHLATGQIGKPGCGPFSLTGQPNAMGGRDVGYMSHLLPGQRQIANADHRLQIERFWGLPQGTIYPHAGYDAVRMFDALESRDIRAIWIVGTNPAASMPNLPKIRRALERADLVIVQDAYYPTETTRYADVLLPAAVNLEQSGTFCNSERRVTLMEQVVKPPGEAQPDWWWPRHVAAAMSFTRGMWFNTAEDIFDEFARSTAGRPNDQSALSHATLRAKGPQIWPCPALGAPQERRYTDGVFPTSSGRARFFAREHLTAEEKTTAKFPLLLTTGRVANQWHTRTKTALVPALGKGEAAPSVHMHPADAESLFLQDRQAVTVHSSRGESATILRIDAAMSPGLVWMPIHWNELWGKRASCNEITTDASDLQSKQPALKCCAVSVTARADDAAEPETATAVAPLAIVHRHV